MTYNENDLIPMSARQLENALEYVTQSNTSVEFDAPVETGTRAGTTTYKVTGEFMCGTVPGDVYFSAAVHAGIATVTSIFISFGDIEDYRECPISDGFDFISMLTTLYQRHLAKGGERLAHFSSVSILCDKILAVPNTATYRSTVESYVRQIKELVSE